MLSGCRMKPALSLVCCVLLSCSAGGDNDSFGGGGNSPGDPDVGVPDGDPGDGLVVPDTPDSAPPVSVATLSGRVVAPEGTIPISGALVFLTTKAPAPFPDVTFCDKCVQLSPSDPYAFTAADGAFLLDAYQTGPQYLVVQKGQFRKVRSVVVTVGEQTVDAEFTRLPARMNKEAGDDIPKMAVVKGQWDAIELSLAKLGLAEIKKGFLGLFDSVDKETAGFDMIEGMGQASFFKDYSKLGQYHIVFVPCSGSDGTTCNNYDPDNPQIQDNLRRFVADGGKLYVTDYSYEYVRRPWPGYVTWDQEKSSTGSACLGSEYDANAIVDDPGMSAWLQAQGINAFEVKANWTRVTAVHTQPGYDAENEPVSITPKVWVRGQSNPTTVSFQDRCGRVLFSTYHTESDGSSAFLPQEKALLYVLLEVGVCVGVQPPPK
ncbi:MAG: carboxypeptidase-like regulatory domain-containing protein [Polyangiaceae bacterium]|nr:carboxypeptidase-like regulatory domain-containing protein [Polyangiaceae bacterium]